MSNTYDDLLKELEIPKVRDSYEIYTQLKKKREEYRKRTGEMDSEEENKRLEEMMKAISEAECYFEKLAKEEKKAGAWDGFDYSALKHQGKKTKKKRAYVPSSEQEGSEDAALEPELTFEERYDNIIGFMGTPGGFEAGLEQLKQLGEEGYVVAQRRLGQLYYNGEKSIAADTETAFRWYEKAALQGDVESENIIGLMYMDGVGTEVNCEDAIHWLEKAYEGGDENAAWNLGLAYEDRFDVKDYKKAVQWYEISANKNENANAYYKLGYIYMNDNGVGPDREKAIHWLEKAYRGGNEYAALNLGLVYAQNFVEKDYKEAAKWYEIAANENGSADACNRLGYIYMNGNGVGPNREKAIHWLKKAYEGGNEYAALNLGLVYELYFVEKDYKEAVKWYEIAGNENGKADACNRLGQLYMENKVVGLNREKAIHWLKKAYEGGNEYAALNLARVYDDFFPEKDYKEAAKWYEIAGNENGSADAYNDLGVLYVGDNGVGPDREKAIHWLKKAYEAGAKDAAENLGWIYGNQYEEKDYDKAIKWYTRAAMENESERAMLELGKIYEEVKKDDGQAAMWYQKAIQYGNVAAQEWFDRLIARVQSQNIAQSNKKEEEEKHGTGKFFARWKK